MTTENVATEVADDDFDLTAALSAEFDKAEGGEVAEVEEPVDEKPAGDRERDDKGRFAAKTEEAAKEPVKEAVVAPAAKAAEQPVQAGATEQTQPAAEVTRAPPGWSPTAKAAFAELPADHPIRQAVAQREVEIDKGFAKLQEYKPIEKFAEMAKQSGTTLDRALENYISIENDLRRDFLGGISQLCRRQGVDPVQLANVILARNGGSPSGGEAGSQPSHQTAPVDPNAIKAQVMQELRAEQEAAEVSRSIKEFGSDPKNTFFENVRGDMARLIQSGYVESIQDAYDRACWANPEIRSLLIKQQTAPSDASAKAAAAVQARNASRSITGSPLPGASGKATTVSLEDEIRDLMNAGV